MEGIVARTATAVDNNGSNGNQRRQTYQPRVRTAQEQPEQEEEPVKLSISAAGLRESLRLEREAAKAQTADAELATQTEIDEMLKKMDGLSSQVINGNFSMTDRLSFQKEFSQLAIEIADAQKGTAFTKIDNVQLSQKITDLTRRINDAAVYHRRASTVFMVKNGQPTGTETSFLNIAI